MKIYVAGAWCDRPRIREFMRRVRENGHIITLDWTRFEEPPDVQWPGNIGHRFYRHCALADLHAVASADLLVQITHPETRGSYVELGFALGRHRPAIVIGPHWHLFHTHPFVVRVDSEDEAMVEIKEFNYQWEVTIP